MPQTYSNLFAFISRTFIAMGCLFDCFRTRRHPHPPPSTSKEKGAEKIRLSSLFTAEDADGCVVAEPKNNLVQRVHRSSINDEQQEEAKFLKACGTLPETPAEVRKNVGLVENLEKSDVESPHERPTSSAEAAAPVEVPQAEKLTVKLEESWLPLSTIVPESSPETSEEIHKAETFPVNLEKSDSPTPDTVLKSSPYSTPKKVTDDMQTPGTVFATNMASLAQGNAWIRSEYVHTLPNSMVSFSQQRELEENSVLNEPQTHEQEHLPEQGNATRSEVVSAGDSSIMESVGYASLSSWLKPPPANNDASRRKPKVRNLEDRPIIGLVATHWNEQEETTQVSPKWWDGNGIPNSTTKYKEDQKVHWHATPFEERLEKALSEDTYLPQRKLILGTPIMFEETEGDTATSQLQSINHAKSVVSF